MPRGGEFHLGDAWKQATITSVSQIALATIQVLDVPMVELVSGAEEAAYYSVASRIAVFVGLPLQIACSTALPSMTMLLSERNTSGLQLLVKKLAFGAAVPGFAFAIVSTILGPYLLPLIYGREYAESAFYLPFAMLYQSAVVYGGVAGTLLLAGGKEWIVMKLCVLAAAVCLSLQLMLGFLLGPLSIPLVSFVVVLWLVIAHNSICQKEFHVDCLVLPVGAFKS